MREKLEIDQNRRIRLIGDIGLEAFSRFSRRMHLLEAAGNTPVHVSLASEGGSGMAALAIYDRIKHSTCKVSITGIGPVFSAAVIILAAGDYRYMTRNAWVMVHDDTPDPSDVKGKRVAELRKQVDLGERLERQWNLILADNSKTSVDKWKELHDNETYLSAEDCLELGLIEEIICPGIKAGSGL